ncbi:MAG: DUF58 domain-containing protein [Dehalococcoidales bacterium]|nr:DUF58 domain-containing protein [Dehalococcoidales bacterium]
MFGNLWLFITILLCLASLILNRGLLLLVAALFFLTGGVAKLWGNYCLRRVEYHRKLSSERVFFGEEVTLEVEVSNRKPLPLPWIQIDDEIPKELTLLKGKTTPSRFATHTTLSNLFSLSWYHKVKRRYPLQCRQRGYFTFGPAEIRSGDFFGLFTRTQDVELVDHLMVYPKILPLEKLGIPSKQPLGDIRTRNHIFQDPVLTAGVREYHFGDSLKRIHWKSTARLGQLQTKVFEPTTTVDMGIFMDVRTVALPHWGNVPELLELVIVTAASISNYALSEGYRVGLYVNQNRENSAELIRIPPSQHVSQMKNILEALSPVRPFEMESISSLVINESRNLPWGSTLVVITAIPSKELLAALFQMKRTGRKVALITVGDKEAAVSSDGLIVYHVSSDVMWDKIDTLNVMAGQ